ncbi:hypothetical protein DMENIID0001_160790 [Sergentomyia squamirostris]
MSVLQSVLFSDDFFNVDPWMEIPKRGCCMRRPCHFRMSPLQNISAAKYQKTNKDGFEMNMDLKQFKPEEITVKAIDDNVVVEAKHEEREDDQSFISRHVVRRYTLPKDCNIQELSSTFSSNGVLTLKAPPLAKAIEQDKGRTIEIKQSGEKHIATDEKIKIQNAVTN